MADVCWLCETYFFTFTKQLTPKILKVTVMRKDGKPLTHESIETIWMYHDHLLDLFGDGATPRRMMTSDGFKKYCANYKEECLMNGRTAFANMPVPL